MKQLDIKHFAKVIDTGISPWGPWWSLEWIEGYTLRAAIDRGTHWSSGRLFKLMLQLCEALEGLHSIGITHGDLNANNVMYTPPARPEDSEKLTLIDLALPIKLHLADDVKKLDGLEDTDDHERHSTEQRMSDELRVFGQPIYLAPECLKGQRPNHQTDLYSLGMIFFELTTGTLPFQTKLPGVIYDVLTKNAPAASMIQKPWPYPPALDALIGNLLSKVPRERCESVQEVKEQLLQMMAYLQTRHELTATDDLSISELERDPYHHDIEETLSGQMSDDFREELLSIRTQNTHPSEPPQDLDSAQSATRPQPLSTEPPQIEYPEVDSELVDPYLSDQKSPTNPEVTTKRSSSRSSIKSSTPQYTPPRLSLSSARRVQLEESQSPPPTHPWVINLMWMFIGMAITLVVKYLL
jgi:serine/threonine protein kinase